MVLPTELKMVMLLGFVAIFYRIKTVLYVFKRLQPLN